MAPRREYPRQPRRPIRQVAPTPATTGSLALADPVVAVNPFQSGAQIYPTGMTSPDNAVRNPNPPIDKISDETPPLTNYGATGTSFFGGIIQSDEYNPEFGWRDAVIKYEQMSRNDSQIMAIKQQFEMPILAARWSIEPASDDPQDQEIASFVQSCLMDDMCYTTSDGTQVYQSWNETLRQILMYKWYGFSLLELCFRIEDGWVKWSRWLPLLPRTVWRWYVGADNELESVEQWAYKEWTYQYNRIPRGKLLHFANRMEGQNYQGISVLRSAFANWWYKQQFLKIAAIEIERNAIIPPVIKMGPGPSSDEVNAALKLAQNIRANELMGVVIGHDMEFQYPRMTERGAAQILPLIEYHDNMIARNILGQFINLGSHEVGSYALAQQQYTNFLVTAQGDCQYVCDVINHQAIRQLVDYNYDGVAVYPKLTVSRLVSQDITTLSTALQHLAAYVPPSPEVNDAIADALGLPKPPQSLVETTNPTSPTTPERPENERADDHTSSDTDSDTAQTEPGHASGGGGGTSGTAGYQDTQDSGGGDGTGFSERVESQALTEFRLLRESLDAFSEHVTANDAVERGVRFLGGHEPGYTQNRDGKGHWAPGEGDAHGGGSGSGRGHGGSGGAGGGESSHPSKGEHAATAKSSGSRSGGSSGGSGRGSGKAAKGEKPAKETRVTRKHLDDAETAAHEAGSRARMAQVHHAKAQEELAHAAREHAAAHEAAKAAEHEFTTRVQGVRSVFTPPHQVKAITQAHQAAQEHERNAASRHQAQQALVHIAHRDAEAAQHEHEAAVHHLDHLRQAHEAQKAAASQAKGEKAPKESGSSKKANYMTPGHVPTTKAEANRAHVQWNLRRYPHHTAETQLDEQLRGMNKSDPRYKSLQHLRDLHHEGTALTTQNELNANRMFGARHAQAVERYVATQHRYQELLGQIKSAEAAQHSTKAPKEPSATKTTRAPRAPKATKTPEEQQAAKAAKAEQQKSAKLEAARQRVKAENEALKSGKAAGKGEKTATAKSGGKKTGQSKPVPIAGPDLDHYSPYGRLNPYELHAGFGGHQLRAVLSSATPSLLREAVSVVHERNPSSTLPHRGRKADMIDYIMKHVAGESGE